MDLHEHQGKELFAQAGIPVAEGRVAFTADEARAAAEDLGGRVVVKAQVLTGGRGKAGGVKVVDGPGPAQQAADTILGLDIKGHITRRLLVERAVAIADEYYFSITFDRAAKMPLLMLTTMGGMDVEAVAEEHPDRLARLHVDPALGYRGFHGQRLMSMANVPVGERKALAPLLAALYGVFADRDAMLVEVNPLVRLEDDTFLAADAKVTIDDNALYRQPDVEAMRDLAAADPQEQAAREADLAYVKLDGDVGILGNGAGLVMSTVDVIAQVGGRPANFCDVGGGASAEKIATALGIVLSDDKVQSVLFNIFGGITRGDEVAKGLLGALEQTDVRAPIVVRLDGTNAAEGRALLAEAARPEITVEETMLAAAETAVRLAGEVA
ncbi:MAG: ADP-forming succinate--CoA ligase subunit beta [Actinobacteria bacterium]|nr:ADP-forming succinate--CoA ligase subunit beta [Actinomycetota bacterium]